MSEAGDVLIRREGRAGRITLDRPKALNALTLVMVRHIWPALRAWENDPAVELVVLDGAGDRGLCAGGDVRWLYDSRLRGSSDACAFWREEYRLNELIGRYRKPFIALMDGIVMGGGIGLSAHARGLRVVTERSRIAMPETSIGLIPDVGATFILSRSPGATGVYLGLLGEQIGAADAILTGFADVMVPSSRLAELTDALVSGTEAPQSIIARHVATPPPGTLAGADRTHIEAAFAEATVEGILARLAAGGDEWHAKRAEALRQRSPKALKLTLAAIREARKNASLKAALTLEFRLCVRLFEDGEFIEGVRAAIIDKDRKPRWQPSALAEVTDDIVALYLAPTTPGDELGF